MENENKKDVEKDKTKDNKETENNVKNTIERAEEAAERLEAATAKFEEIVAKNIFSGQAEAGQKEQEKPEITNKEYAKKALSGDFNNDGNTADTKRKEP